MGLPTKVPSIQLHPPLLTPGPSGQGEAPATPERLVTGHGTSGSPYPTQGKKGPHLVGPWQGLHV